MVPQTYARVEERTNSTISPDIHTRLYTYTHNTVTRVLSEVATHWGRYPILPSDFHTHRLIHVPVCTLVCMNTYIHKAVLSVITYPHWFPCSTVPALNASNLE